jgi:N6-L-threonylcarbamoyladenine synthase
MQPLTVLGIESSCDDTAAGVVRVSDQGVSVLSNVVLGQADLHALYGGVVPEIAARAHADRIDTVVLKALSEAQIGFGDLSGVAATSGPGLIGGLAAAVMAAKAISLARSIPFVAVNHLEAHALSPRLGAPIAFPYILLLASGGHCQLLLAKGIGDYQRLGSTIDDAAGECLDKCAKLMGLGFPGGPALEQLARGGDPARFCLPEPLAGRAGCGFSFSGLKTAAARLIAERQPGDDADLAASIQEAVAQHLCSRTVRAMRAVKDCSQLVVAGGVAANVRVRTVLQEAAAQNGFAFYAPPLAYCTDNGAMVALAGAEYLRLGHTSGLDIGLRPRWPLDEAAARTKPAYVTGKKGVKA